MTKLGQILGKATLVGDVGIEIEVEFNPAPAKLLKLDSDWFIKGDGSLRGDYGCEFVSCAPVTLDCLERHINSACSVINSNNFIKDSPRTSVHVHVNCLDKSPIQIYNGLILAWMVEEYLLKKCGKSRQNNRFCLPIRRAPLLFKNIQNLLMKNPLDLSVRVNDFKYANVAYHNLDTLGTIEFRGMRGVYDPMILIPWIKLCYNIINAGTAFTNPLSMVEELQLEDNNFEKVFDIIGIKDYTCEDIGEVSHNYYLLNNLIYGLDWSLVQKTYDNFKPFSGETNLKYFMEAIHVR